MGTFHLQFILLLHVTGDIDSLHRTANVKLAHMVAVEGDIRISAHTFQTEEILLSGHNSWQREFLADRTLPMKVAMFLL